MKIRRILVPVDFSHASLEALAYAADLAKGLGAKLAVLHVVEPLAAMVPADLYLGSTSLPVVLAEQEKVARRELASLVQRLARKGIKTTAMLQSGGAFTTIGDVAKRTRADLIVMATEGRTGLSHMLLGSVAEKVVRTAPCPVLTVRSKTPAARSHRLPGARPRRRRA